MIRVDDEKCTGCGTCIDVCPAEIIKLIDQKAVIGEGCLYCGACEEVCEAEAIIIEEAEAISPDSLDQYRGVWIFAEQRKGRFSAVVYQLLGKGRELADKLGESLSAVVIGADMQEEVETLPGYGADTVYYVHHPLCATFNEDIYTTILVDLIRKHKPEIVLAGATSLGRSLIPGVATILETGLTADCTGLEIDPENRLLLQTRPAYGGQIMATIICPNHRPQMATVRSNVLKKPAFNPNTRGEIVSLNMDVESIPRRTELVEHVSEETDTAHLADARIVVSGGRGLKDGKNFELLQRLAKLLGGAVGASRAAVDAEWIPYRHQVGQTGKTVNPRLYMAFGISGALQHVVGMESSDIIVAVNKDRHAPIFDIATYGIEGDIFEIIPALIKRLEGENIK